MNFCVVGAGAIGGLIGAHLALAGYQVTLIARGAHLAAIRERGLTLEKPDGTRAVAHPALATSDMAEAGPYDVVIIGVKAHQLPALAPTMRLLYHKHTMVVAAQNGVPWWYFQGRGGPWEGRQIISVDPAGVLAATIEPERVIGCVVYPAAEMTTPGFIRHTEGNRLTLGEPNGKKTERVQQLSHALAQAGFKAPVREDIRTELWIKLWGNAVFNPISALTGATLVDICQFPPTRDLAAAAMTEVQTVAEKFGIHFGISLERRIAGAEQVGAHKTSMLQDIEAGKPTEVEALVGAVAELGRLVDVPTPHLDTLYAGVRLLERKERSQ